jgi:hypothetical protein
VSDSRPSFAARIVLAWVAYFRTLFDADFAAGVVHLRRAELPPGARTDDDEDDRPSAPKSAPPPVVLREATPDAACQLLALLQREGRFVDFLQEDIDGASDADIGAATRVVHEGCRKALREHITIEPIRTEDEGTHVTVDDGFDASELRLTGKVVGDPPFEGKVSHRGWRATKVTLPKMAKDHDASVLAPAEIEL